MRRLASMVSSVKAEFERRRLARSTFTAHCQLPFKPPTTDHSFTQHLQPPGPWQQTIPAKMAAWAQYSERQAPPHGDGEQYAAEFERRFLVRSTLTAPVNSSSGRLAGRPSQGP